MKTTRIRFATDCQMAPDFFLDPRMGLALRRFALEAPPTVDGIVLVTSASRPPAAKPSYHARDRAFDVRSGIALDELEQPRYLARPGAVVATNAAEAHERISEWVARVRRHLPGVWDVVFSRRLNPGPGYDAAHLNHVHAELDLLKDALAYTEA